MSHRTRSLNLRQIEVFRAIMLTGGATDAAKALEISQPAVSRLLTTAENVLGILLFDRVKGRLVPTPQARALYHDVEAAYRGVLRVQDVAGKLATGSAGHIRILGCPSAGFALAPRVIAAFRRRANGVRLSFEVVPQPELVESIAQQQADLGIALSPPNHPAVAAEKLAEGGLICIALRDHPLAALEQVRARDLAGLQLISLDRGTAIGRAVDDAFAADGVRREIAMEVGNSLTAASLVLQGAGAAIVEAFAVPAGALAGMVARHFVSTARFALTLLRNRSQPGSAAISAFAAELRSQVAPELFAGQIVVP